MRRSIDMMIAGDPGRPPPGCLIPLPRVGGYLLAACAVVVMGCGQEKPSPLAPGTGGAPAAPDGAGTGGSTAVPVTTGNGRRVRRLSNREYNNVIRDLLGDSTEPANAFIADSFQNGYDSGAVGLVVQSDQVESFQEAAESLAARAVSERLSDLLDGCAPQQAGDEACLQRFLVTFAPRAFRRPLTADEVARLRAVFDAATRSEPSVPGDAPAAGGFARGIQTVVETILQSPQFLYREELGVPGTVPGNANQVRLTSPEIASALSFLFTGTMPDPALFAAVAEGRLNSPDDFKREALRLLGTPHSRESMRTFLHQWLATDHLAETTKDPSLYPTFNIGLALSMRTELDQLFDAVLWRGTGSLRELFTSADSFVDAALAPVYGLTASEPGWRSVRLDPTTRAGVLTRAGFLTAHADQDSSGPIARGVFLLASVLCAPPLPRPATVPVPQSAGDTAAAGQTTRQRFAQHASDPHCAGCHLIIDGVGFGFEEFDGMGIHRAAENGSAVDSSGTLYTTGDVDGPFSGVSELSARLVQGRGLPDCFVKQVYRLAMGQIETASDGPLLSALQTAFSVDRPVTDLLTALVADPAFVVRNASQAAP